MEQLLQSPVFQWLIVYCFAVGTLLLGILVGAGLKR